MSADATVDGLRAWVATQLRGATEVEVGGLDRVELGHSAETLLFSVRWTDREGQHEEDVVARVQPPEPGLLPPYNLERQFDVLRALEPTAVRSPRAFWHDSTGAALGRELYVMERLPGDVYEQEVPASIAQSPETVRRMCESMIEQAAAIHSVDLDATGLRALGDGNRYLERELDHWAGEIRRVQRGPLPGLERLVGALREGRPEPTPRVTLVHGDCKPGNFAFVGTEVSAVFDWEMASVGDPLADIGWAEVLWDLTGFTTLPGALSRDDFVTRWEGMTGIEAHDRNWYRAFQLLKMTTIQLVAGHLFDTGWTDDRRFLDMAYAIGFLTQRALGELGIAEELDTGPVLPRKERIAEVTAKLREG